MRISTEETDKREISNIIDFIYNIIKNYRKEGKEIKQDNQEEFTNWFENRLNIKGFNLYHEILKTIGELVQLPTTEEDQNLKNIKDSLHNSLKETLKITYKINPDNEANKIIIINNFIEQMDRIKFIGNIEEDFNNDRNLQENVKTNIRLLFSNLGINENLHQKYEEELAVNINKLTRSKENNNLFVFGLVELMSKERSARPNQLGTRGL